MNLEFVYNGPILRSNNVLRDTPAKVYVGHASPLFRAEGKVAWSGIWGIGLCVVSCNDAGNDSQAACLLDRFR